MLLWFTILVCFIGLFKQVSKVSKLSQMTNIIKPGFMAMDTAMTNNWHQPIQSIGSSKGDGIVFKHMMRVYFQPHADKIPLNLDKDVLYEIQEDYFPTDDVHALSKLMAEHSASIPDHLSISYLPISKWKHDDADLWRNTVYAQRGRGGGNALLAASLCAGAGRKRSLNEMLSSCSNSSSSAGQSSPGTATPSSPHSAVGLSAKLPSWIVSYLSKAMFAYNGSIFSNGLFSQVPWNMDPQRGFPEFVLSPNKQLDGVSLNTCKLPCVVHMVMHGVIKIHQKNSGAMWIATKAKLKDTGEELVYMKCWHPMCKQQVVDYRKREEEACTAASGYKFDGNGWALVCKKDLECVIGSVQVDKDARI